MAQRAYPTDPFDQTRAPGWSNTGCAKGALNQGGSPAGDQRGAQVLSYPVTFEADYVEQRNRLTTFFRLILAIPVAIVLWFYEIVAFFAVIFAWFAIAITGRFPDWGLTSSLPGSSASCTE